MMKEKLNMALCEGRHSIPEAIDGAIFKNTLDPLDLEYMHEVAEGKLAGVKELNLYVTGLTVALVEVIKVCKENNINLLLHHYNVKTQSYYVQTV